MKGVIMRITAFAIIIIISIYAGQGLAEEPKKIQDNSFLIEEAYNQEDGVVQHIQAFQYQKKSKEWLYTFTQEWPVPKQAHQFSYTIPFAHLQGDGSRTGISDIALNYRYQLIMKDNVALAPRFSLLLPTGDYREGFGNGALGYQVNIPLSIELSHKWVTHWNAGATVTPRAREASGAKGDLWGYNLGASVVYLLSENVNVLTEVVWNASQALQPDGSKVWENSFFINPGARFAINFKSGLQIVPGISFPIGVGSSRGEYGVLLYLSFEHKLF
ncbi:MAG: transporter [Synergistaceae bacterium]|nr:transporter [Synergistaceae bacterium]